jgi:hypothetical protein
MNAKIWKVITAVGLASVLALFLVHAASARPDGESDAKNLVGTWDVTITLQNCSTGAQVGLPFQSLLTFNQGGTMTETTSNPMFFPAMRGPGHGTWNHAGHRTYDAASLAFITSNGVLTQTQKISQTIELGSDRDSFTVSNASVQFFDPAGALVRAGCANATGKRFE